MLNTQRIHSYNPTPAENKQRLPVNMSTEKKAKHGHESDDDDYYERFVRSFQHNTGDDSEGT